MIPANLLIGALSPFAYSAENLICTPRPSAFRSVQQPIGLTTNARLSRAGRRFGEGSELPRRLPTTHALTEYLKPSIYSLIGDGVPLESPPG